MVVGEDGRVGVAEVRSALLAMPGVDPRLVASGWVENHYRYHQFPSTTYGTAQSEPSSH